MKEKLIMQLISLVLGMLTPTALKDFADKILDIVEDRAVESKTKWDDITILPMCKLVRSTFDIPDDDDDEAG